MMMPSNKLSFDKYLIENRIKNLVKKKQIKNEEQVLSISIED
jgi:hypothetical protein